MMENPKQLSGPDNTSKVRNSSLNALMAAPEQPDNEGLEQPIEGLQVLSKILEHITKVNFASLAYDSKDDNVSEASEANAAIRKTIHVLIIDHLLKVAKGLNLPLRKDSGSIYAYNESYWCKLDKEPLEHFLGQVAQKMGVHWIESKNYKFRETLSKQFNSESFDGVVNHNKGTVLINLANGTFEVSTKEQKLRPFCQDDFLTYQLPFNYNKDAVAPEFLKFLGRVLPDIEDQKVLAEYLGYIFLPHRAQSLKLEKALILYGTGANGKSVVNGIVSALLGPNNISAYPLHSITDSGPNGLYTRAVLSNKLLNYTTEISGKVGTDYFKKLVSGEPVEARLPYGEPFTVLDYPKLMFNCNELPNDVEHTDAYFRRFIILKFSQTIPAKEQDPELPNKIISTELSGIFNWVLDGLTRLLTQGRFTESISAQEAIREYRTESDSVLSFIQDEGYIPSKTDDEYILLKELYSQYKSYCTESGLRACSVKKFSKRLENAGCSKIRKNTGFAFTIKKMF